MNNRYLLFIGAWILFAFARSVPVQAVTMLDTAFGLNGRVAVELGVKNSGHAVVVQPDGKIVVAGSSSDGTGLNFSLIRFNHDGSLDTTFNGDGSVVTSISPGDDEILALGLLSDGRIVAAGYSHNGTDRDFALACYLQNGSLDPIFGDEGVVLISIGNRDEEITALTVNAQDMITVAGTVEGTAGRVLATARYYADGQPDSSYGEFGFSIIGIGEDAAVEGIIERPEGSLVVSGSYQEKNVTALMLVGLSASGVLDRNFGVKGVGVPLASFTTSEGYRLAADTQGLLYVAGSVGSAGKRDTALFRFTMAGKPDASFGNQGVLVTKVSEEDDVLYDVILGKSGVVASGYTTDAGTRQFLLATYADTTSPVLGPTTAEITKSKNLNFGVSKNVPIEKVWETGNTKVQIRRLQIASSYTDYTTMRYPSLPTSPDLWAAMAQGQVESIPRPAGQPSSSIPLLPAAIDWLGAFLLPSAVAAEGSSPAATKGPTVATVVSSSFSEGGSVSYAVTSDQEGNIIVVGTADNNEASSIVAARFAAEIVIDIEKNIDQPGYASRHISTTVVTDVTRTTATIGGEVTPAFGKTVIKRGVVFSVSKNPVYAATLAGGSEVDAFWSSSAIGVKNRGGALTSSSLFSTAISRPFNVLAGWLVADAVAASTASSGAAANSTFVEEGEIPGGSGYGSFSIGLSQLKPGTAYYVRAYALTSDGAVYYGNQLVFGTADSCFVATASFGTLLHPSVTVLRDFRDTFLLHNGLGRRLVALYYTFSPPLADGIAQNAFLRFTVRMLLLPFVGFSWLALQVGMISALLSFVVMALLLGWFSSRVWMRR